MRFATHWTFLLLVLSLAWPPETVASPQNATATADEAPRLDKLGDPLPKNAILRMGTKRFIHLGSGPSMITLSNDEKIIFSMDDSWMMAWNTETGKLLWKKRLMLNSQIRIGAAGYGIRPMAIMPDSGKLVNSSGSGEIVFWDIRTGKTESVKSPTNVRWKSIDVSSDAKLLALGGAKGLWVCKPTGELLYKIANEPEQPLDGDFNSDDRLRFGGDFSYARFSPNGKLLALVNSAEPKTIQLFNPLSGDALREISTSDRIVRMDFSPDSSQIVASERDSSARLYDVNSTKLVWEFVIPPITNAESYTSDIDFRPDGKQIAVGAPIGSDYRIRLLNPTDGKETGSLDGCGWKPWPMQYTRDSKLLYGSGWSANINKWDTETEEKQPLPGGAVRASSFCAMSGDDQHLVFTDRNGIHLVEIETGETKKTFNVEGAQQFGQLTFNHTGSLLALGYSTETDIKIAIWDLESEKLIHDWSWNKGRDPHSSVEALAFSKDGNRIAAAVFRQSAAYVFDLPSDQQIAKVRHRSVYGLDINKDGTTLFTTGWDKAIRVWDCESGEETLVNVVNAAAENGRAPDTRAYGLKLSNDEKFIATCDMTRKIRFFDRNLKQFSVIEKPGWFSYGTIAISNNDLWFGVGTGEGARVFDIASGDKVFEADEHDDSIYTVGFGARDQSLISGGTDGVCYLWDISHPDRMPAAESQANFSWLIGADGRKAYQSFMALQKNPESTVEILRSKLGELVSREVKESQIKKWIVALGADDQTQQALAKTEISEQGPSVCDQLATQIDSEDLSEKKRATIQSIIHSIHREHRRATILLAELNSPKVDDLITELLKMSATKQWKLMLFEAKKHRRDYLRNQTNADSADSSDQPD